MEYHHLLRIDIVELSRERGFHISKAQLIAELEENHRSRLPDPDPNRVPGAAGSSWSGIQMSSKCMSPASRGSSWLSSPLGVRRLEIELQMKELADCKQE